MGIFKNMADKMRTNLRSFLQIEPAPVRSYFIRAVLDWNGNCIKNMIWYRGDANELEEFYKQVDGSATRQRFWSAAPIVGREIEKIHTGLPAIMVDTLSNIIVSDLNDVEIEEKTAQDTWDAIAKDNDFNNLVGDAVSKTCVYGDGVWRVSIIPELSAYPVIDFVTGDRVKLKKHRGRLVEVIIKTDYVEKGNLYTLEEHHGRGYIENVLKKGDKEVPIGTVDRIANLPERIVWDDDFMLAIPMQFFKSKKYDGRGGSLFDTKTENFDALDEVWSQWMDALRRGRTKEYIPETMIPRNPKTGDIIMPSAFDNAYIQTDSKMGENAQNRIEVVQPAIRHDSYLATYITALDLCLQGIMSPSTLGIDNKKLDNAEAQREKEKTTLYTRNQIIGVLQEVLPKVAEVAVHAYETDNKTALSEVKATIQFGEYANPSFESQVETVGKARTQGIMSIEASVEELYGDTKEEEWKKKEVARLKAEQGIAEVDEPTVGLGWEQIGENQNRREAVGDDTKAVESPAEGGK
jgi:hypothetical protein